MESISQVLQASASPLTSRPLIGRLSEQDGKKLTTLVKQMAKRYPSQDLSECLEGYLRDFEALALKHGLKAVRDALAELRIVPGQAFFPRPDEVAEEIERALAVRAAATSKAKTQVLLSQWEADFWAWVDSRMSDPDTTGMTEQQFLDTVKVTGWTGRKARGPGVRSEGSGR